MFIRRIWTEIKFGICQNIGFNIGPLLIFTVPKVQFRFSEGGEGEKRNVVLRMINSKQL